MDRACRCLPRACSAAAFLALLYAGAQGVPARADGTINGNCWLEKVKGRPGSYLELYEWNLYLTRDGGGVDGQSCRVGAPPQPTLSAYSFTAPAGNYTMFLDQPFFFGRPTVVTNVGLPSSGTVSRDVLPPTDYVCAFGNNSGPWGSNPWTPFASTWYQTFIATGTSITGMSFKLAGTNTSVVNLSIHQDNGGSITTWPQVGPTRGVSSVGTGNDNWIRCRSGQIPTTPGQRYALKLTGVGGSPNSEFAVFRRLEDGQGYAAGQAYNAAGQVQSYDLYAMVFTDNDGTLVSYCALESEQGELAGWSGVWTQSVKAMGTSFAGAVMFFAGGSTWDKMFTFRIRSGSVTGPQVGPSKFVRSAYQTPTTGFVAASWAPGEVPLTPGQVYFIEMGQSDGFNPARFTRAMNSYAEGTAYQSFAPNSSDLLIQVVEYGPSAPPPAPTIDRSPAALTRSVVRRNNLPGDTFTIANSGGGLLTYAISSSAAWLAPSPAGGDALTETDTITIVYDTASLSIGGPYSGALTITAPGATNTPQTVTVTLTVTPPPFAPCDFDQDHDVDQADFGRFQNCLSGAGIAQPEPACAGARLDNDEDVDADDFIRFQGCMSGSNNPADTACAD